MRTIAVLMAAALAACTAPPDQQTRTADSTAPAISVIPTLPKLGSVEADSGPPVRLERTARGVRLVMVPEPGDQINALQPPVLQTTDGRRLELRGSTVTADSAYFTDAVLIDLAASALPLQGTLTTSYCRAGEKLCRTATRAVNFGA